MIILTGFAGFIGSQILRDLIDRGYNVIGIDNLSEGSSIKNYIDVIDKFIPLYADIADPKLLNYLKCIADDVDSIIHVAAESHVDRSWNQIDKFVHSNIMGSINMAKIGLAYKVERFVYINTDEIWAGSSQPFTEESIFSPQNAYASSKASADHFLMNYHKAFGLPLIITHGANTYGERQQEKIIPKAIECILKNKSIPLYRTPALRMWLSVKDHSNGIIAALERGKIGERYCLAPSEENELYTHELLQMICDIMGKNYNEVVQLVEDRPNYDLRYWMKNDKAKRELGWNPTKNIREELSSLIEWYKKDKCFF